ncbi:MAG TPA: hypothetical protein VI612_00795 [Candidatus Nanoarchaeia archaeon]|nr:hypothetical protein [Candidatus Nanoarchaeia archaeon]
MKTETLLLSAPVNEKPYWELTYQVPTNGVSERAVRSVICRIMETYMFGRNKDAVKLQMMRENAGTPLDPISEADLKQVQRGDSLVFRIEGTGPLEKELVKSLKEILENEPR